MLRFIRARDWSVRGAQPARSSCRRTASENSRRGLRRPVMLAFEAFGPLLVPPITGINMGLLAAPLGQLVSGPLEASGLQQMKYSKFASGDQLGVLPSVPSKIGMLVIYLPGTLMSAYSVVAALGASGGVASRALLVATLLLIHFLKRALEVGFLHRYSGRASLAESMTIGAYYGFAAWAISSWMLEVPAGFYSQVQFSSLAPVLGTLLFAIGIAGNLYHHRLLADLRKDGSKHYKVPTGGLFDYATCPHFFCELLGWYGIVLASQQIGALGVAVGMTSYLTGRAIATQKWYKAKLDDYPTNRKAIIPFIL
mmetsp:Transcript_30932/g.79861  ORF Transcript_30932/g.79861 Transcript_30932/m.79861 type:complete len:311 (+) Transcript_30932:244-1176(+)